MAKEKQPYKLEFVLKNEGFDLFGEEDPYELDDEVEP